MSNVARVAGQAANTLVKPLEVEDVFSTYLYTGTGSSQTITNGIDLSGEGGLVWGKTRNRSSGDFYSRHFLYDTERGTGTDAYLHSDQTDAQGATGALSPGIAFNTNGFTTPGPFNNNNEAGVSWTFRKAPKFFDVVTYTGTGSNLTINHNLGSVPGCIIIKCTSAVKSWVVYHRGVNGGVNPEDYALFLNTTDAQNDNLYFQDTAPTSTQFFLGDSAANENGQTHVAYLFAHNNGDGDFGPDGDADIIKCGSYQSDGNGSEISVDLGFEPQFVMAKAVSTTGNWHVQDSMRGMAVGSSNNPYLQWNTSDSESADGTAGGIVPTSNGFRVGVMGDINIFNAVQTYIYIAIRRGTAVPTSATEVFAVTTQSGSTPPAHDTGFVTDFSLRRENALSSASVIHAVDRLRGKPYLTTEGTNSETNLNNNTWDFMDGWFGATSNDSNKYAWSWKRAPKYMDVVAYTGDGVAGRTVSHNLGVAPEMIWVKNRTSGVQSWRVYNSALGATKVLTLNQTDAAFSDSAYWNNTEPTSSVFSLGTSSSVNDTSAHIAYLFASLDGISKVGSVSHTTGSNTDVDCGFSAGARFVILKGADIATGWLVFDSTRGIISGNSPSLILNSTSAEDSSQDRLDPYSSGFSVGPDIGTGTWIYYAIA